MVARDLVRESIKQVPALSVLAFIVWMFLGHIGACEERSHETHERLAVVLDRVASALDELDN